MSSLQNFSKAQKKRNIIVQWNRLIRSSKAYDSKTSNFGVFSFHPATFTNIVVDSMGSAPKYFFTGGNLHLSLCPLLYCNGPIWAELQLALWPANWQKSCFRAFTLIYQPMVAHQALTRIEGWAGPCKFEIQSPVSPRLPVFFSFHLVPLGQTDRFESAAAKQPSKYLFQLFCQHWVLARKESNSTFTAVAKIKQESCTYSCMPLVSFTKNEELTGTNSWKLIIPILRQVTRKR